MKKTVIAIISALLVALIAVSFVGCMKVTMTEKSILSRLEKEEYVVMSGHSMIPTSDPMMAGLKMKKTIYAYKMDMTVHEEYGEIPSAVWEVAIYFTPSPLTSWKKVSRSWQNNIKTPMTK